MNGGPVLILTPSEPFNSGLCWSPRNCSDVRSPLCLLGFAAHHLLLLLPLDNSSRKATMKAKIAPTDTPTLIPAFALVDSPEELGGDGVDGGVVELEVANDVAVEVLELEELD